MTARGRDAVASFIVAFVSARALTRGSVRRAPENLMRVNVNGKPVPAVLGLPLSIGMIAGVLVAAAPAGKRGAARAGSIGALVVITAAAGWFDDTRGAESARGFRGHLRALRRGRLTGGVVKMGAGAAGGLSAGRALVPNDPVVAGAAVALAANLANLLDRAPGRVAKVGLLPAAALAVAGERAFRPVGAAALGALAACLPADLREEAMLGDAGANALGAVLGLGGALAVDPAARRVLVTALALANGASERWSFSALIERVRWLRAVDLWGRTRAG